MTFHISSMKSEEVQMLAMTDVEDDIDDPFTELLDSHLRPLRFCEAFVSKISGCETTNFIKIDEKN